MKEYKCSECLNKRTPICYSCSSIESPDGEESKPKHYQANTGTLILSEELTSLSRVIESRVAIGLPINVSWVIRYNQLVASNEE